MMFRLPILRMNALSAHLEQSGAGDAEVLDACSRDRMTFYGDASVTDHQVPGYSELYANGNSFIVPLPRESVERTLFIAHGKGHPYMVEG